MNGSNLPCGFSWPILFRWFGGKKIRNRNLNFILNQNLIDLISRFEWLNRNLIDLISRFEWLNRVKRELNYPGFKLQYIVNYIVQINLNRLFRIKFQFGTRKKLFKTLLHRQLCFRTSRVSEFQNFPINNKFQKDFESVILVN